MLLPFPFGVLEFGGGVVPLSDVPLSLVRLYGLSASTDDSGPELVFLWPDFPCPIRSPLVRLPIPERITDGFCLNFRGFHLLAGFFESRGWGVPSARASESVEDTLRWSSSMVTRLQTVTGEAWLSPELERRLRDRWSRGRSSLEFGGFLRTGLIGLSLDLGPEWVTCSLCGL